MRTNLLSIGICLVIFAGLGVAWADVPSNLPTETVQLWVSHPGSLGPSYFDSTISGMPGSPGDYDVSDGLYVGWCVDQTGHIYTGESHTYNVKLISSYDPSVWINPTHQANWSKVNYIINNRATYQDDEGEEGMSATWDDIQQAIWYFVDGHKDPTTANGLAIVADADANGGSFEPEVGEMYAVICDPLEGQNPDPTQVTFIETTVLPVMPLALGGVLAFAGPIAILLRRRN